MGNIYSKTSTSRDIAEKDDLGIDAAIRAATERGKAWRDNPQSLLEGLPRPVAPKPSMLERGGLALQAGVQAGAKTPYESGWANLLSGIGTGIQSGMGYDALMQQQQAQAAQQELAMRKAEQDLALGNIKMFQSQQEQELYNIPIGQLSPAFNELGLGNIPVGIMAQLNSVLPQLLKSQMPETDSSVISDNNMEVAIDYLKQTGMKERDAIDVAKIYKGQSFSDLRAAYKISSKDEPPITFEHIYQVSKIYGIPLDALKPYVGTSDRRAFQNALNQFSRVKISASQPTMGAFVPTGLTYKTLGGAPKDVNISENKQAEERLKKLDTIRKKLFTIYDKVIDAAEKGDGTIEQAFKSKFLPEGAGAEYRALISNAESLITEITKSYFGEVGNLAEKEQQRAYNLIPKWGVSINAGLPDTAAALRAKKNLLKYMFDISEELTYTSALNSFMSRTANDIYGDTNNIYNLLEKKYAGNEIGGRVFQNLKNKYSSSPDMSESLDATGISNNAPQTQTVNGVTYIFNKDTQNWESQ